MQSGKGEASVIFCGMDQSQRCLSKFLQEKGNDHSICIFFIDSRNCRPPFVCKYGTLEWLVLTKLWHFLYFVLVQVTLFYLLTIGLVFW